MFCFTVCPTLSANLSFIYARSNDNVFQHPSGFIWLFGFFIPIVLVVVVLVVDRKSGTARVAITFHPSTHHGRSKPRIGTSQSVILAEATSQHSPLELSLSLRM